MCVSLVYMCYLWACAAWRGGRVVRPRDGQVITATLPPQTLDVK